jgi:hypothetical protein
MMVQLFFRMMGICLLWSSRGDERPLRCQIISLPEDRFLMITFSNEEKISSSFRRVYFVLIFSFKSPIYVDIMRVFKVETKVKRSRPNGEVIISSLLNRRRRFNNKERR